MEKSENLKDKVDKKTLEQFDRIINEYKELLTAIGNL